MNNSMDLDPTRGDLWGWVLMMCLAAFAWFGRMLFMRKVDRAELEAIHKRLDEIHEDVREVRGWVIDQRKRNGL